MINRILMTGAAGGLGQARRQRRAPFAVGHTVVFGASNNRDLWWDNSKAAQLGWHPRDSSERFRAKIEALPPVSRDDPMMVYQGGRFVTHGPSDA